MHILKVTIKGFKGTIKTTKGYFANHAQCMKHSKPHLSPQCNTWWTQAVFDIARLYQSDTLKNVQH